MGPAFELEGRYAQVLTTLFVTMLFAGAIPLLLPLAALALALSFWVDKLAFFRYSNSLQAYIHTRIYTVWPIHTELSKAAQPAWHSPVVWTYDLPGCIARLLQWTTRSQCWLVGCCPMPRCCT